MRLSIRTKKTMMAILIVFGVLSLFLISSNLYYPSAVLETRTKLDSLKEPFSDEVSFNAQNQKKLYSTKERIHETILEKIDETPEEKVSIIIRADNKEEIQKKVDKDSVKSVTRNFIILEVPASKIDGIIKGTGIMGSWAYGSSYWNFMNILYATLLIGLIILVCLWILKLWKCTQNKSHKK